MTNTKRAERASIAFYASDHSRQNNDALTNLYDLICDLCHFADTLPTGDEDYDFHAVIDESVGQYAGRMGLWHYSEECAEERIGLDAKPTTL